MRVSVGRFLCAAMLLPALLASVAGVGFAGWRCHMQATVHATRCCPAPAVEQRAADAVGHGGREAQPSTITAQRCCEVTQVRVARVPSDLTRPETISAPVVAVFAQDWVVPAIGGAAAARPDVAPKPGGDIAGARALLLRKQSFLI